MAATGEIYAELTRTLGPLLGEMCSRAQGMWPELDPELLLVNWLCHRRKLDAPKGSLRHRSATPSTAAPSPSPLPPSCPATRPTSRVGQTRGASPSPLPLAASAAATAPPPTLAAALPSPRAPPAPGPLSTTAPAPVPALPAVTNGAYGGAAAADSSEKRPLTSRMSSPPRLASLKHAMERVNADAMRMQACAGSLKEKGESMKDAIADKRIQMRFAFLAQVPLFGREVISENEQLKLTRLLQPINVSAGETIIRENEVGDQMYFIERGTFEVYKNFDTDSGDKPVSMATLAKGAHFGDLSVMYDIPRKATILAVSKGTVLRLSRADLYATVGLEAIEKMRELARAQFFSSIPLLVGLSPEQAVRVACRMQRQVWTRGATVATSAGGEGRLFIVETGSCRLFTSNVNAVPSNLRDSWTPETGLELGTGQSFGMLGLLSGAPLGATVVASRDDVATLSITQSEILATFDCPKEKQLFEAGMHDAMTGFLLCHVPQLAFMEERHLEKVRQHVEEVHFKKWSVILVEGDVYDSLWILKTGKLVGYTGRVPALTDASESVVPSLECELPGASFGGDSITELKVKVPHTVVARTDCTMLRLSPIAVRNVRLELLEILKEIPLFSDKVFSENQLTELICKMRPVKIPVGRDIVKENQAGDRYYIILQGHCFSYKLAHGREHIVAQHGRGHLIGEMQLIHCTRRTVNVRSASEVTLLALSSADLQNALADRKGALETARAIARLPLLRDVPFLAALGAPQLLAVARTAKIETWEPGSLMAKGSDAAQPLQIVVIGSVELPEAPAETSALVHCEGGQQCIGVYRMCNQDPLGFDVLAGSAGATTLSVRYEDILCCAGPESEAQRSLAISLLQTNRSCLLVSALKRALAGMDDRDQAAVLARKDGVTEMRMKQGQGVSTNAAPDAALSVIVVERGLVALEERGVMIKRFVPGDYLPLDVNAALEQTRRNSHPAPARSGGSFITLSECQLLRVDVEEAMYRNAQDRRRSRSSVLARRSSHLRGLVAAAEPPSPREPAAAKR
eukprot:TRINITY_DN14202_c0_g1_i1.p1 TRINITY_DN14202_c0_g1~~TRINITY_DN14202_c0_g1_i1.p1  ORF type:complete len:1031 (+),score=225.13 TRINITY_DN14202_c0_g1_i1:84-3176(+)